MPPRKELVLPKYKRTKLTPTPSITQQSAEKLNKTIKKVQKKHIANEIQDKYDVRLREFDDPLRGTSKKKKEIKKTYKELDKAWQGASQMVFMKEKYGHEPSKGLDQKKLEEQKITNPDQYVVDTHTQMMKDKMKKLESKHVKMGRHEVPHQIKKTKKLISHAKEMESRPENLTFQRQGKIKKARKNAEKVIDSVKKIQAEKNRLYNFYNNPAHHGIAPTQDEIIYSKISPDFAAKKIKYERRRLKDQMLMADRPLKRVKKEDPRDALPRVQ